MNYRSGILFITGLLGFFLSFGQAEIDYRNKSLLKALEKSGVEDESDIEEIAIPESEANASSINGKFFAIRERGVNEYLYIYVGRVNSCRAGGCSISNDLPAEGESEYFDYYILFDENRTVRSVKVFNYQATHGHEVTAKGWLRQFIKYDGSRPLIVEKDIDSISGATISVYALTLDIEMKTKFLQQLKHKQISFSTSY